MDEEDYGPTEDQSKFFELPSEEEHLLSGGRLRYSSIPAYTVVDDWEEYLEKGLDQIRTRRDLPYTISTAAIVAKNHLGDPLTYKIGDHTKPVIRGILLRENPGIPDKVLDLATKLVYSLTKSSTITPVEYLDPGPVDCPERES